MTNGKHLKTAEIRVPELPSSWFLRLCKDLVFEYFSRLPRNRRVEIVEIGDAAGISYWPSGTHADFLFLNASGNWVVEDVTETHGVIFTRTDRSFVAYTSLVDLPQPHPEVSLRLRHPLEWIEVLELYHGARTPQAITVKTNSETIPFSQIVDDIYIGVHDYHERQTHVFEWEAVPNKIRTGILDAMLSCLRAPRPYTFVGNAAEHAKQLELEDPPAFNKRFRKFDGPRHVHYYRYEQKDQLLRKKVQSSELDIPIGIFSENYDKDDPIDFGEDAGTLRAATFRGLGDGPEGMELQADGTPFKEEDIDRYSGFRLIVRLKNKRDKKLSITHLFDWIENSKAFERVLQHLKERTPCDVIGRTSIDVTGDRNQQVAESVRTRVINERSKHLLTLLTKQRQPLIRRGDRAQRRLEGIRLLYSDYLTELDSAARPLPSFLEQLWSRFLRAPDVINRVKLGLSLSNALVKFIAIVPLEELIAMRGADDLSDFIGALEKQPPSDGTYVDISRRLSKFMRKEQLSLQVFDGFKEGLPEIQTQLDDLVRYRNDFVHRGFDEQELLLGLDRGLPDVIDNLRNGLEGVVFLLPRGGMVYQDESYLQSAINLMGRDAFPDTITLSLDDATPRMFPEGTVVAYSDSKKVTVAFLRFLTIREESKRICEVGLFDCHRNGADEFVFYT